MRLTKPRSSSELAPLGEDTDRQKRDGGLVAAHYSRAIAKAQGSGPSPQTIVGLVGCLFGALMMLTAVTASFNAKSSIHEVYSTLNWGFGVQTVLLGSYVISQSKKE